MEQFWGPQPHGDTTQGAGGPAAPPHDAGGNPQDAPFLPSPSGGGTRPSTLLCTEPDATSSSVGWKALCHQPHAAKATELRKFNQSSENQLSCEYQGGCPHHAAAPCCHSHQEGKVPGRVRGNSASFPASFQQSSSSSVVRSTGGPQKPPASGKVVRDKQQEGTQRAASLPAQWCVPHTARWGQRISWDKAQPVRQSSSQGGLAFPVTPIRCGDIWEHGLATTAAAVCFQCWTWVVTGPNWKSGPR